MTITVQESNGERIDLFLAQELPELSRSRIQSLLKDGHILLNGEKTRPKIPVATGDSITVTLPEPQPTSLAPQDIPLDILHEDEDLIVINKPVGLVVHPAAGNPDGTLVNALLHHCEGALPRISGEERPGIVHRLDKDTSGCIVTARTDRGLRSLLDQFSARQTTKLYLAVTERPPVQPSGSIFTHIGRHPVNRQKQAVLNPGEGSGRPAITDYYVLSRNESPPSALVLCHLHTGRTHQIRVHMKHLGCPLLGDPVYAHPNRQTVKTGRLMLHAWRLGFTHPAGGEFSTYEAPPPREFESFLPDDDRLELIRNAHPEALEQVLFPSS
ncbi:MAG: RNA pseudouridine synthase [Verrucomicrobiaceae bacterium]|nr:RNA pseudouridine synthase [Verrucomicrobiaceae bacterium]